MNFSYILGGDSVTVFLDRKPYAINRTAKTFNTVMRAISESNVDALRAALDIRKTIVDSFAKISDKVRVEQNKIFYEDREVTGLVAARVFDMLNMNVDIKPMVRFIENLMQNPSKRAVDELFGFMDACKLPITEDGYFLAYKRVNNNYTSVHDGKTDNSIGKLVEMPRNAVDEDAQRTCSYGLHFCSYDYLTHFSGERIVVLKINPADVVAIPVDYNNSKGRACKYLVVDEIPLNEYRLPSFTLPENYTTETYNDEEDFDGRTADWVTLAPVTAGDTPLVPGSTMTQNKLDGIRADLEDGQTYASIAAKWNISPRQVGRIDRGEAWNNF